LQDGPLVELDALGGDLDLRIGADPQRGSLLGVLRATESDQGLDELLERWLCRAQGWLPTLVGPPDARAHDERASAGAITGALHALAGRFPVVVCDVGFQIEGGDIAGAHMHREAVVSASAVVVVLGAREGQLRHGLDQLDTLVGDLGVAPERTRVIVNGIGVPGAPPRAQIENAITDRLADRGLAVDAWLPWDRRAARRAVRAGAPLAVARPRGGYARAVGGLVDDLFLPARPTPRGRKRRLPSPSLHLPRRAARRRDEEVSLPWRA
jgi:Flp pilus assembly CpaE family ATPase